MKTCLLALAVSILAQFAHAADIDFDPKSSDPELAELGKLYEAVVTDDFRNVSALLAKKKPEELRSLLNRKTPKGYTILEYAVGRAGGRNLKIVDYLVYSGASVNSKTHKGNPISDYASAQCDSELADLFLKNGLDLKLKNPAGQTFEDNVRTRMEMSRQKEPKRVPQCELILSSLRNAGPAAKVGPNSTPEQMLARIAELEAVNKKLREIVLDVGLGKQNNRATKPATGSEAREVKDPGAGGKTKGAGID